MDKLSTNSNSFLFGFQPSNSNKNVGKIYSAYGALRFGGNQTERYIGRDTVRGMAVDHWQSCMYWNNIDATMTVDWYFSGNVFYEREIQFRCIAKMKHKH